MLYQARAGPSNARPVAPVEDPIHRFGFGQAFRRVPGGMASGVAASTVPGSSGAGTSAETRRFLAAQTGSAGATAAEPQNASAEAGSSSSAVAARPPVAEVSTLVRFFFSHFCVFH